MCRSRGINAVETNADEEGEEKEIFILNLSVGVVGTEGNYPAIMITLHLGAATHSCKFKLDTGADANVIPLQALKTFAERPIKLRAASQTLQTYGGDRIECLGTIMLNCGAGENSLKAKFYVIEREAACILGHQTCEDLGLVIIPKEMNQVSTNCMLSDVHPTAPRSL